MPGLMISEVRSKRDRDIHRPDYNDDIYRHCLQEVNPKNFLIVQG